MPETKSQARLSVWIFRICKSRWIGSCRKIEVDNLSPLVTREEARDVLSGGGRIDVDLQPLIVRHGGVATKVRVGDGKRQERT